MPISRPLSNLRLRAPDSPKSANSLEHRPWAGRSWRAEWLETRAEMEAGDDKKKKENNADRAIMLLLIGRYFLLTRPAVPAVPMVNY